MTALILASGSAVRARLLRDAGLEFEVDKPRVDEEAVKAGLRAEGLSPRDQADALAEVKALSVSRHKPGLVIGADQILVCDGQVFDKAGSLAAARQTLLALRGKTHELVTAAIIAKEGAVLWRRIQTPRLRMRDFSDDFLETYLEAIGEDAATRSVGAYELEGRGAQLFAEVQGDFFSVLGLPLLAILDFLRLHGVVRQ